MIMTFIKMFFICDDAPRGGVVDDAAVTGDALKATTTAAAAGGGDDRDSRLYQAPATHSSCSSPS